MTGAAGFLGKRLTEILAEKYPGARVTAIARSWRGARPWAGYPNVRAIEGDLLDAGTWAKAPPGVTHLFHTAAHVPAGGGFQGAAEVILKNITPIARLIERGAYWRGLRQIIYSSSVSVYPFLEGVLTESAAPSPGSAYGAAKLAGESLLSVFGSKGVGVACLRYGSIYGHGQKETTVLPTMIKQAAETRRIKVYGHGKRLQNFLYVDDAAGANILAMERGGSGAFNIGSGASTSMSRLAEAVNEVFAGGSAVIEFLKEYDEGPGLSMDIAKARRELGYEPLIPLEEGLRRIKERMDGDE